MSDDTPEAQANGNTNSNEVPWIELAKIAQTNFFNRRSLEWKLSFGVWGGVAVFTGAVIANKGLVSGQDSCFVNCILLMVGVIYCVFGRFWFGALVQTQKAHRVDKDWMIYYMKKAAGDGGTKPPWKSRADAPVDKEWLTFHTATTTIFLLLSLILVAMSLCSANVTP